MKEKQLTNLLAAVVRQVATEDVYLDRALRDIFKDKKVVDPNIRRALSLLAPFIFRNWYALGGGGGDGIISIVNRLLKYLSSVLMETMLPQSLQTFTSGLSICPKKNLEAAGSRN